MRSFIKSHRRTSSDEADADTGVDLSLRSRLKNPITFIKQRRRASCDDDEYVPSAAEYKEAGSIFGTRTHDWGSPRSPHEPPLLPATLEAALQAGAAKHDAEQPETYLPDVEPQQVVENGEEESNINKSTAEEDILELEHKIDELIRETHDGLTLEALPQLSDDDIASKGEQDINSNSSRSLSSTSSGSGRSAFSFEEDKQIGRNSSVNYHTAPADAATSVPAATGQYANGPNGATGELSALAPQFQDEYYDDFDEIYQRNDGHLLGVSQFAPVNDSGTLPQHYSSSSAYLNLNTPNTINTTFDDYSGGYTSSRFREEDDDDQFYDSLLDEVNAVPDEDVDDVPPPLQRNGSRSSFNSVYMPSAPSSYYSPASRRQMLRKAKSYSFEGSRSQLAAASNSVSVQRRQTSVIKSDTTTTTLFGKLPQEMAPPPPLFLNTQSSSSFLSKKLSDASSLSNLTTLSTGNTSFIEGLDYYDNEAENDDPSNFELSYPSKLNTALTPISERSYDSDYSHSPV